MDRGPDDGDRRFGLVRAHEIDEVRFARDAVERLAPVPRLIDEPRADQIVEHRADLAFFVRLEPSEKIAAAHALLLTDELEDGFPQCAIRKARRLRQTPDLLLIAP